MSLPDQKTKNLNGKPHEKETPTRTAE